MRDTILSMTILRVGLLGGGTVGAKVAQLVSNNPQLSLTGVLVRDTTQERPFPNWQQLVTDDPAAVLTDADIIVEVMGGTTVPLELLTPYLQKNTRIITANKALLAEHWEAFDTPRKAGRLFFEAAVMGGVPVIGTANTLLRASELQEFGAVLNGTCNVVLASMEEGQAYEDALRDAQAAGFAEADPYLDVSGLDAAHKLNILIRLLADPTYDWGTMHTKVRGIDTVTQDDIAEAKAAGKHIRLVGSARLEDGQVRACVRPERLPAGHPLLTRGVTNAFWYRGDPLGELLLRGPGAGAGPTAAAVYGDILSALAGAPGHGQHA